MLKQSLIAFSILTALTVTTVANAATDNSQPRAYISVLGGASFYDIEDTPSEIDDETAGSIRLGAGMQIPFNQSVGMRVGVEGFYNPKVTYDIGSVADVEVTATGVFLNANFDMLTDYPVHPYVGLGLGVANIHSKAIYWGGSYSDTITNFAYHVGGGLLFDVNDHFGFDISARYANYGEVIKNSDSDIRSFDLLAGFKFAF